MGVLNKVFFKIGYLSASNPFTACFMAICLTVVCALGFINYRITVSLRPQSDPSKMRESIVLNNSICLITPYIEQPIRTLGPANLTCQHRTRVFHLTIRPVLPYQYLFPISTELQWLKLWSVPEAIPWNAVSPECKHNYDILYKMTYNNGWHINNNT